VLQDVIEAMLARAVAVVPGPRTDTSKEREDPWRAMRAAVYYANDDVRLAQLPVPRIGAGEILVRVRASGICGSDVMEWYRKPRAPLVLGHEIAAEVTEVGSGVSGVRVGDRVFVSHHVPCGACRYCQAGHETVCDTLRTTNFDPGGFAEYVRVPAANVRHGLFHLPAKLSDDEAVFIEPLACVVRGQRLANLRPGATVLVIGSGVAGLLHVKLAKASGAARVIATDVVDYRKAAASRAGADLVIDGREDVPARVRAANDGRLADLVVTCTGAPAAIAQGLRCVDRGGTVLFFAPTDPGQEIVIPFDALWREEVTLTSSYAGAPRDIRTSIELLASKRVPVAELITHTLPLEEAAQGFRLVADAKASLKVVLRP
jgi:L-iditol 2-dehydrogenase